MQHADILALLANVARTADVSFRTDARVVHVAATEEGASVTLATGEVLNADVVVGADGARGVVRRHVAEAEALREGLCTLEGDRPRSTGLVHLMGTVPLSELSAGLREDPIIASGVWCGAGESAVGACRQQSVPMARTLTSVMDPWCIV